MHRYILLLSRAGVSKFFNNGIIIPILKKSTLNQTLHRIINQLHYAIYIPTKMVEAPFVSDTDVFDNQFRLRESLGTAFACNLLNDFTSCFKSQTSPVFVTALEVKKIQLYNMLRVTVSKVNYFLPLHEWLQL